MASPLTQRRNSWLRLLTTPLWIGALIVGCAGPTRESGAVDAAPATQQPAISKREESQIAPAPAAAPVVPPQLPATSEQKRDDVSAKSSGAALGSQAATKKATPAGASAPRAAKPAANRAASDRAGGPASDEYESAGEPAFAEPPELALALSEFESQLETLSTTRACDDACKALESMRRSAKRICDLVLDSDPRERCQTARARLERAARDLSTRCSDCR